MTRSVRRTVTTWLGAACLGFVSSSAWALSCDEIVNMVNVNVPENIVIQTMEQSGTRFSADDIRCMAGKLGAKSAVVETARRMSGGSEPAADPPPERDPEPADEGGGGDDGFFELQEEETGGEDEGEGEGDSDRGSNTPCERQLEELVKLYRAKKVLTSSKGFFDLMEDGSCPQAESKIYYYLAKALFDLEMYHSAQYYFMQVVRRGPKNPYFKYALPKLVVIAQLTSNDAELLRIVHKIPPDAFPRQARNHLYYLMGRKLYEQGELSAAGKYFAQISPKSDLYLRSKYFEGVIHNERGKLKSAVKSFRDVYQAEVHPKDAETARVMEELRDLSLINIARIYYGLQRYDNADNYYALVERDSPFWAESLFERGWTSFMRSDMNLTLGLLLTVNSPYYLEDEFIPEATVLRALTFFSLCEYKHVERVLLDFEATYQPMRRELKGFMAEYATPESRKLTDQAFDAYFDDQVNQTTLEKKFFSRMLRNRDLSSHVQHLDLMDEEERLIDQQKSVWRDTIGSHMKKILEQDRTRYKRKAGQVLLGEMQDQYRYLGDLMSQSQIIRFEVVDAQRVDYEYKMQNPDVESFADRVVDYATRPDIIYWPFNGEFWLDELGYYRYTEHGACR